VQDPSDTKLAARNYGDDRVYLPENGRQKCNERVRYRVRGFLAGLNDLMVDSMKRARREDQRWTGSNGWDSVGRARGCNTARLVHSETIRKYI